MQFVFFFCFFLDPEMEIKHNNLYASCGEKSPLPKNTISKSSQQVRPQKNDTEEVLFHFPNLSIQT